MNAPSIEEDFVLVLPQMGSAKGPLSGTQRRSLILQAIHEAGGAPQLMLKNTSFTKSAQKLAAHLDYISRNGDNEVFDRGGNRFSQSAAASENGHPREALQLYGSEIAVASQTKDKRTGGPRSRLTMNMMLSMPAGADKKTFELAVVEFLSCEYAAFDYVYAFHDDRDHYHAHVVVGLRGSDGRWLDPRKQQLAQWQQNFAASLKRRGIAKLEQRGTRRGRGDAPSSDARKEDEAIKRRAQAWRRIAKHYSEAGDVAVAAQISGFVADSFAARI